jgi:arylsulfatase A-like enzyme
LIVLDTVRAENMSAYGYARETTPGFDALAREGALYLDATSPSTWSLASHASLFTGLFPSVHGAHFEHRFLEDGPPTLAETLAAAGYETVTFTANAFISDTIGLTRGFRAEDEAWRAGAAGRQFSFAYRVLDRLGFGVEDKGGGLVATNFEKWAAEPAPDGQPFFIFLNFIEAHFPYHQLPESYLHLFTELPRDELHALSMDLMGAQFGGTPPPPEIAMGPSTDMYDGGIVYTDHLLGRVVEALRRRGKLDDTVLVVMADHGELLGEHGSYGHGAALYEPGIRVPLLVRYPPRVPAGARVATPVSTVGVYATILDLLDLEPSGPLHVSSLLPVLTGGPPGGPVMAERHIAPVSISREDVDPMADTGARIRTYRAGSWKLVVTSKGNRFLFDLATDPGETRNLADARPEKLASLLSELDTWRAALALPAIDEEREYHEVPDLDPAARERLRALGYVE